MNFDLSDEQRQLFELAQGLAIQFLWVLLAYAWARLAWHRGIRKYAAVGG